MNKFLNKINEIYCIRDANTHPIHNNVIDVNYLHHRILKEIDQEIIMIFNNDFYFTRILDEDDELFQFLDTNKDWDMIILNKIGKISHYDVDGFQYIKYINRYGFYPDEIMLVNKRLKEKLINETFDIHAYYYENTFLENLPTKFKKVLIGKITDLTFQNEIKIKYKWNDFVLQHEDIQNLI